MSEFLGIDIKTLDSGEIQFCQTGLIRKVLEATGMEDCNGLRTPTKVEAPLGTDVMVLRLSRRMVPVIIGNTQRENQCLSS